MDRICASTGARRCTPRTPKSRPLAFPRLGPCAGLATPELTPRSSPPHQMRSPASGRLVSVRRPGNGHTAVWWWRCCRVSSTRHCGYRRADPGTHRLRAALCWTQKGPPTGSSGSRRRAFFAPLALGRGGRCAVAGQRAQRGGSGTRVPAAVLLSLVRGSAYTASVGIRSVRTARSERTGRSGRTGRVPSGPRYRLHAQDPTLSGLGSLGPSGTARAPARAFAQVIRANRADRTGWGRESGCTKLLGPLGTAAVGDR